MYKCEVCNSNTKADYMFNEIKCMDCVTLEEAEARDWQEGCAEARQEQFDKGEEQMEEVVIWVIGLTAFSGCLYAIAFMGGMI